MNSFTEEILIKEYETLKGELKDLVSEINTIARYSVLFAGAVFGWILTKDGNVHVYDHLLKWLPFAINLIFCYRTYSLYTRIELISSYIEKEVEKIAFRDQHLNNLGWESYLNDSIRKAKSGKSKPQLSAVVFWIINLLATLLFPILK
jgi:hypothetical protein